MFNKDTARPAIEKALDQLRPNLQLDGGDLQLIDITDDGVVTVRFQGACVGCPHIKITLKQYIERLVQAEVNEVKEVILG